MREAAIIASIGAAIVATMVAAAAPSSKAPPVRFATDVAPLFERECAFCHTSAEPYGALSLEPAIAHDQLVGAASSGSGLLRVAPGRPQRSYLYLKLTGKHREVGGAGTKMPPGWQSLPPEDLALIERWIREGAKNN